MGIYIFGAGQDGTSLADFLLSIGMGIKAFIDNDERKHGVIRGIRCIGFAEAINEIRENDIILISVKNYKIIEENLQAQGITAFYSISKMFPGGLSYYIPDKYCEEDYRYVAPFNQFDSPYPDMSDIHNNEAFIFDRNKDVYDVDLNVSRQMELIDKMPSFDLLEWNKTKENAKMRYFFDNNFFTKGDAITLFYMLQILRPKRIIEVGSGFSTSVMLDTNEFCFGNDMEIISIEPYPDRLRALLKESDNIKIHECELQKIPLEFFEILEENDILFIDSSHVSKIDSDVNYIFFEILPRLKHNVYIHFHDIFYPFIYPKQWIYEGRAYSEMYILRAFLMNNKDYSIQLFVNYLQQCGDEKVKKCLQNTSDGGSIWIKKL